MKTTHILIAGMLCFSAFAKAQSPTPQEKTKTPTNLPADGHVLDQQAQILGNVFGDLGGIQEMQGITGYMDLLTKSNLSPELKKKFTEQYQLIALSDDPSKKKEMELKLTTMLQKAIQEGQEKDLSKTKG